MQRRLLARRRGEITLRPAALVLRRRFHGERLHSPGFRHRDVLGGIGSDGVHLGQPPLRQIIHKIALGGGDCQALLQRRSLGRSDAQALLQCGPLGSRGGQALLQRVRLLAVLRVELLNLLVLRLDAQLGLAQPLGQCVALITILEHISLQSSELLVDEFALGVCHAELQGKGFTRRLRRLSPLARLHELLRQ